MLVLPDRPDIDGGLVNAFRRIGREKVSFAECAAGNLVRWFHVWASLLFISDCYTVPTDTIAAVF